MMQRLFAGYTAVLEETSLALAPVLLIFTVYHIFYLKVTRRYFVKIFLGVVIAFAGLTLFLQGVNIGYIPVGAALGELLADLPYRWILVPIGFFLGFSVTTAEPSVHVLVQEIDKVTAGAIPKRIMFFALCIGVAVAIALAMVKILAGLSLWYFLIPGYVLALILSYIVPPVFTAIAFDSGGVATGTMTATFLLSLAIGAASRIENANPLTDGFGIIALVAVMPILTVLGLGLLYRFKERKSRKNASAAADIDRITVPPAGTGK
ncbi:DUF1538 domain-containing protein [Breznakiella homolactica]|uniref:DUF1538 domain-containing protein n=1 Tax=Breznakiella homolactica TaxID=2798577 RepID=A0A7T7XKI8_9SPIR|nr:DUF1538 domain-containing protein [Breznakiella homolactica]QQO07928.1 DUF1538 domain-containing protein [Breznakiella homolactica]